MAADAYASADQAAIRIEKRLRRYKRRLKDRHAAARSDGSAGAPNRSSPELCDRGARAGERRGGRPSSIRSIIAESTTSLKRLPVSEAVLELDLTGAPVIVFRHAGHGRVNVVYRRPDGHIGWIDPPALDPGRRPLTRLTGASLWSAALRDTRAARS